MKVSWQAHTVEAQPIDMLLPYAANARAHSPDQVAQLAASIAEFGFTVPALVDEAGVLIAGHGRVLAARTLGLDTVPTIRLGHLSAAQARAYRLADNQLALNADWDETVLADELRALRDEDFDLGLIGFDSAELDRLLSDVSVGDESAALDAPAPAPPANPVSQTGELWNLGSHRLLCGSATDPGDVARLLESETPHLMVTDPPYGVEYDPTWRNTAGVSATQRIGKVANDHVADWREAWALFPGDVAYVWHAAVHARVVLDSLDAAAFAVRSQIVWCKPRFVLGRGDYHWQHEPCLYAVRRGATGHWQGARDQATVWTIGTSGDEDAATVHGTQKPVECMRRPMVNNSSYGDAVYEPFSGSGTSIIAAESTGRRCLAMEIDPAYCDVAIQRWQSLTGLQATLSGEDISFDEAAMLRHVAAT